MCSQWFGRPRLVCANPVPLIAPVRLLLAAPLQLDDEARQSAFIKVKTTMQTSDVIANIETFTSHWCKLAAKGASKTDRGIILSGPPGTGKTTILQGLIDDSGFYNIVGEPLNGSSFNTSFVGQSEGLIRDVFARGKKLWWLPCGLIIDELEVMVPTRFGDKESRESKVDMLITLLDTFQGGNDVPNVYCFGATNRQNTIDEAFLRRLEGKFYVGLLEPASRREFLKNKMAAATADFSHASDETQPSTFDAAGDGWLTAAVHMTTGFSGGKVAELIKYVNREFEGHNEVVSWDGFVRACTELCVRENIYFAEKVLPVYLKDRQSCGVQVATAMREAENSTGKVFIDLSKGKCGAVKLCGAADAVPLLCCGADAGIIAPRAVRVPSPGPKRGCSQSRSDGARSTRHAELRSSSASTWSSLSPWAPARLCAARARASWRRYHSQLISRCPLPAWPAT